MNFEEAVEKLKSIQKRCRARLLDADDVSHAVRIYDEMKEAGYNVIQLTMDGGAVWNMHGGYTPMATEVSVDKDGEIDVRRVRARYDQYGSKWIIAYVEKIEGYHTVPLLGPCSNSKEQWMGLSRYEYWEIRRIAVYY